jgi:hypothetical protein
MLILASVTQVDKMLVNAHKEVKEALQFRANLKNTEKIYTHETIKRPRFFKIW